MSVSNDGLNVGKGVHLGNPPPQGQTAQSVTRTAEEPQESPASGLNLPSFVYMALLISFLLLGIVFLRVANHRIQARASTPPATTTVATPAVEHPNRASSTTTTPGTTTDPGSTVVVAPPTPPPLRLQAVFFSPTKPSAIVSGTSVGIGDKVRQFHVTAIGKDSVTLSSPSETKVLKLQ